MRCFFSAILVCVYCTGFTQSVWPGQSWSASQNLTTVMNTAGILELSGAHWNPELKRLYVCEGTGKIRVLSYNSSASTYSQMASFTGSFGGTEGITQAIYNSNQFYIVDESNYEIKQITHNSINNYSGATVTKSWNMLAYPSPMTNTGNSGPEGIEFIPDSFLIASNFISEQTGLPYSSTKGMGGLMFIAHQDGGYIWVFDLNPLLNDDFVYVGKYKTNRSESCGLEFERSSGLLYILHNTGSNYVEVTNLSTSIVSNKRTFNISEEYLAPNTGNIEGIAVSTGCKNSMNTVWFARDAETSDATAIQLDALRAVNPFYPTLSSTITSNAPICVGNNLTITTNTVLGYASYQWLGPNNFNSTVINPVIVSAQETAAGNYSLTISSHGCTLTSVKSITVNANPTVTAVSSNSIMCVTSSAILTVNGANTYTWNPAIPINGIVSPTISTNYTVTGVDLHGCVGTATVLQTVSTCTGIKVFQPFNQQTLISVYPNPSKGVFTIENAKHGILSVLNIYGQIVCSETLTKIPHKVDLSNFTDGIYFFKFEIDGKQEIVKVIKLNN